MPVENTEDTLTVDANVIAYCLTDEAGAALPAGLRAVRVTEFRTSILDTKPLAFNDFLKTEYEATVGQEAAKKWLTRRLQANLIRQVPCRRLPDNTCRRLRDDYGFDCQSRDVCYLETCHNTEFKRLITENTQHFDRPHSRNRRMRGMRAFVSRELGIAIFQVDESCVDLL